MTLLPRHGVALERRVLARQRSGRHPGGCSCVCRDGCRRSWRAPAWSPRLPPRLLVGVEEAGVAHREGVEEFQRLGREASPESIPMNATSRPRLVAARWKTPNSALHCSHHEAHLSSTTGHPFSTAQPRPQRARAAAQQLVGLRVQRRQRRRRPHQARLHLRRRQPLRRRSLRRGPAARQLHETDNATPSRAPARRRVR